MFERFQTPIIQILEANELKAEVNLFKPPDANLGDFCFVVNQVAGKLDPLEISKVLEEKFKQIEGIDNVIISQRGNPKKPIVFLNFKINPKEKETIQVTVIDETLSHVFSEEYGMILDNLGKKAIVEHTSANPISVLHVGNLRNSVQGDTYARILEHTGFEVFRHFYINDVGLQISFVVVGYELAQKGGIKPPTKIDIWLGQIYAIMNCLYTIQRIKSQGQEWDLQISKGYNITGSDIKAFQRQINAKIKKIDSKINSLQDKDKLTKSEKIQLKELKFNRGKQADLSSDLIKYQSTYKNLKMRFPELFDYLLDEVKKFDFPERVANYLKHYEKNTDQRISNLFREVVNWNIQAFKWTLNRYNIHFDQFDFESDLTWSGLPEQLIEQLSKSDKAVIDNNAIRYQYPANAIDAFCKATGISKKELPVKGNIPDLQLKRSDGTALYAAKDIAYSVQKFRDRNPDLVYNVIGTEQTLAQFQLLLPLHELGMTEYAKNLKHYNYEAVDLRGRTMSGRLAQYVTADDFYDETFIRARIAKRAADTERGIALPSNEEEWMIENNTLRAVTLASTRFPLVEIDPKKRMELDLDRELDFKRNAGPFVEYAHARAKSLIEKANQDPKLSNIKLNPIHLATDDIVEIADHLKNIDNVLRKAANTQDPSQLANWCFQLAQLFMKFYEKYPIIKAETKEIAFSRLLFVKAIQKGLAKGLEIMGIPAADQL